PEIQQNLEPLHAHEMLKELKTLFAQQAEQELLPTTKDFHSCRQEEGQSVSSYVLKMKGYIDNLERLGHPVTLGLGEHMAWQTDYCIMKEEMSILREHKSVPGMNSSEREMERSFIQKQPSTSGTLPSNTIPNPKEFTCERGKLFELAKVPLNENCSAMLLKKLPEKLGDPGKFLIPCDFLGIEVCHALADLGESINLMPLSIWKKLSLPELTPTRMTLELADRSINLPKGVVEDVFVKVGKFHYLTDFVVVYFEADPRVPLILGRSFLRTGRALIDVYGEEITLKVNDESITFNLNQTMRYSLTYDDTSVNRVDVIDVACEDFVQDVLDFQYNPKSSSPTLVSDDLISESDSSKEPIVKSSSPTLTPFGESDFFLEEIEDFLNDDSIPIGIENSVYDPEGDILFS
nr:reverse transcriptase domain-containing protein [Tanacetum cinerariifolium]